MPKSKKSKSIAEAFVKNILWSNKHERGFKKSSAAQFLCTDGMRLILNTMLISPPDSDDEFDEKNTLIALENLKTVTNNFIDEIKYNVETSSLSNLKNSYKVRTYDINMSRAVKKKSTIKRKATTSQLLSKWLKNQIKKLPKPE